MDKENVGISKSTNSHVAPEIDMVAEREMRARRKHRSGEETRLACLRAYDHGGRYACMCVCSVHGAACDTFPQMHLLCYHRPVRRNDENGLARTVLVVMSQRFQPMEGWLWVVVCLGTRAFSHQPIPACIHSHAADCVR